MVRGVIADGALQSAHVESTLYRSPDRLHTRWLPRPNTPDLPRSRPLGEWHEGEIEAFEQADARAMPEPGQVLFIGSSSVRMWKHSRRTWRRLRC